MQKQGKFIVCEGSDFSGKSTISSMIVSWLKESGIDIIRTRHPGSTLIGQELRKLIKESNSTIDQSTEALIMAADNSAFIHQLLIPTINSGTWVMADRNNFISSLAYQIASGCTLSQLDKVHAATAENYPLIDLLLIFRITKDTYKQRMKSRPKVAKDNFEDRGNEYIDKVIDAYDNLIKNQSSRLKKFVNHTNINAVDQDTIEVPRCLYVDANQPLEAVFENCKEIIKATIF